MIFKTAGRSDGAFSQALCVVCLLIPFAVSYGSALAQPSSDHAGARVYSEAGCVVCHGGLGYGGAGPAFRGERLLSADTYVVGQILIGRGIMPSFADRLSDAEIAAVATYIRTSWGNDFGAITPESVAAIRHSLATTDTLTPTNPIAGDRRDE